MHPLAYARGSVTLAESTRLLPSRDRQGAVSSEIPKTFKHPGRKPAAGLILSGCNPETQKWVNLPLPFGPKARLIQIHLDTQAKLHDRPTVEMEGASVETSLDAARKIACATPLTQHNLRQPRIIGAIQHPYHNQMLPRRQLIE